jgi:glyoxylase-like metal-dependent hydrolase (beta-lactamase superfamily II)
LAEDILLHTSWKLLADGTPFPSSGLIVKGEDSALLIDTTWPSEEMPALLDRVVELTGGLPHRLVCTHAHDDRMSGVEIARQHGIPSLAHELTQSDAKLRHLPAVDRTWSGETHTLELGGRVVELFYPGPAHTRDNVVAFIPDAGVLFGGCMFRAVTGGIGNTADADLSAYAGSVRKVIGRYGARVGHVVPGHGKPGGPELLEHTLSLAVAAGAH